MAPQQQQQVLCLNSVGNSYCTFVQHCPYGDARHSVVQQKPWYAFALSSNLAICCSFAIMFSCLANNSENFIHFLCLVGSPCGVSVGCILSRLVRAPL